MTDHGLMSNGGSPRQHGVHTPTQDQDHMGAKADASRATTAFSATRPQTWSLLRKLYTSLCSFLFTFTFLFGASIFSQGIPLLEAEFYLERTKSPDKYLSMNPIQAIAAFSLYIFGILFAPIFTPHLTERVGRKPTYLVATLLNALFVLGASRSPTFAGVAACRFLAGVTGGPIAVLVEGTFADLWPALFTGSYYAFIMLSQYLGAAVGAVVGGAVVERTGDWRWTGYTHIILAVFALIFGAGMPETFPRTLARRAGQGHMLEDAPTGTIFATMARLTGLDPIKMLFTEPLVILLTLTLSLNFGVLFTAFVSVPSVLSAGGFTPRQIGLAFLTAVGGACLAGILAAVLDQVLARQQHRRATHGTEIEFRMAPAMLGSLLSVAALWWIGWTTRAGAVVPASVPVAGVGVYVCGSALQLIGFISYLFDAYPAQATLSALTTVAVARVVSAGWFVLYVPIAVLNIPSQWVFGIWGIIAAVFVPIPYVIFFFGAAMRRRSKYGGDHIVSFVAMEEMEQHGGDGKQKNRTGEA